MSDEVIETESSFNGNSSYSEGYEPESCSRSEVHNICAELSKLEDSNPRTKMNELEEKTNAMMRAFDNPFEGMY